MHQSFNQIVTVACVGTGFLPTEHEGKACICETGEIINWRNRTIICDY